MKNVKRFEIDVETSFGGEDYDGEVYPLQITDLETDYASAVDGSSVAEIGVHRNDGNQSSFQLGFEEIDALFEILTHIREKVNATKKTEPDGGDE